MNSSVIAGIYSGMMVLMLALIPTNSIAQEFRVESQIYTGESSEPASRNLTLYTPKLVYDFLMSPRVGEEPIEIVIYEPHQQLVVLLDPKRKVRVELTSLQLTQICEGLKKETLQNERTRFLVDAEFKEDTDWSENALTLISPSITYRVEGKRPNDPSMLPIFFETLDVLTRLKATDPTRIPPYPRLQLNQSIRKIGWLPSRVEITVQSNDFFPNSFSARSKHNVTNGLTSGDRDQVQEAKKAWAQFKAVDLAEFRGIESKARQTAERIRSSLATDK